MLKVDTWNDNKILRWVSEDIKQSEIKLNKLNKKSIKPNGNITSGTLILDNIIKQFIANNKLLVKWKF